jgi:hypothetical protein
LAVSDSFRMDRKIAWRHFDAEGKCFILFSGGHLHSDQRGGHAFELVVQAVETRLTAPFVATKRKDGAVRFFSVCLGLPIPAECLLVTPSHWESSRSMVSRPVPPSGPRFE